MACKLVWATENIDSQIAWMARISNASANPGDPHKKLIGYLIDHKHWSPFEMASICVKITTTRDIGRQLLRHRSFHFQEFSQRYAEVEQDEAEISEPRLQDTKNRQNSIVTNDERIRDDWFYWQARVWDFCYMAYQAALKLGVAKELARKLLPEGLTKTEMLMCGTVRDWYHYFGVRLEEGTQLEHRELAKEMFEICVEVAPDTFGRIIHE